MMKIISLVRAIFKFFGCLSRPFYSGKVAYVWYLCRREYITQLKRGGFAAFGKGSLLGLNVRLIKHKYISVGVNSSICNGCELSCYEVGDVKPEMVIGNGVSVGEDSHITCANRIVIGDGVLTGKYVLITDNAHGISSRSSLDIPPMLREISSTGAVVIEDNVWIGEKASIMPNVRVGRGAIIAANAVVTKDVPPYSVVAGVPAKIVKQL
ncbi:MAG: acyltransferase [bacterium]